MTDSGGPESAASQSQRFDNIADVYAAKARRLRQTADELIDLANKYRRQAQDVREAELIQGGWRRQGHPAG